MAKAVIMGGGGGGASSDELTAARGDVLKGKTAVTSDSNDEPVEGTLELTGDAADSHVLTGKTYYNKDPKTRRTGTMPNRGAVAQELAAGGSYTIPEGYHNGGGKVTAKSLASQTGGATAADGDVLSGKTYWKDGAKRTGTMTNQGTKTAALNAGGSYAIPAGYHNGSGKVTANSLASQTGGVTVADGDVLSGKTYWKDGAKRTGSMANRGALNVTLDPGSSKSMPSGYYSAGMIKANKPTGLSKKTTNTIARLEHPSNMGKQVIFSAGTDWDTLVIYGQAYAGNTNPSESQWKRFGASCSKAMIASKNFPAVNKAEASSIMNLFILTNGDITWEPSPIAAVLRNVVIERYKAY